MICARALALLTALALASGCAEIESRSTVEVLSRPDASPLVLGPPGGEITARGVDVRWAQDGDRLAFALTESRTCASVRHVPVVRVETIERKTSGGAMWFEYGLGAASLAVGLAGLIKPEAFSQAAIDMDGVVVQDKRTGYRIGGIFTAIGTLLLTAAVVDTVRTRNAVLYTDAYRREQGGPTECREPRVPLRGHTVELLVSGWSSVEATDDEGGVRFLLPTVDELPEDARAIVQARAEWEQARAEAEAKAAAEAEAKAAEEAARAEAEAKKPKRSRKRRGDEAKASDDATETPPEDVVDPLEALGPAPEPLVVKGVLRIDKSRALAIDFVVPYGVEVAAGHEGHAEVEPVPPIEPPPKPKFTSDDEE